MRVLALIVLVSCQAVAGEMTLSEAQQIQLARDIRTTQLELQQCRQAKSSLTPIVLGFSIGAVLGAVVGILIAPHIAPRQGGT
jgi:ABC-type nitrate/sulfonate/bicarbonate transport system permease component